MTDIKICGLMRPCDADYVNEANPDYAGFILSPGFRRSISLEQAMEIRRRLNPVIRTVGVFVNPGQNEVMNAYDAGLIDIVQLHGNESNEFISEIREMTGLPVIKAFKAGEVTAGELMKSHADAFLIDSGRGSGQTFDWSVIDHLKDALNRTWILAGGLNPENIPDAIESVNPPVIDLSSGVETDGCKDREKIIAAVNAARK